MRRTGPRQGTLRERAERHARELEKWFKTMQRGTGPVSPTVKMARAWLDGYNVGRLAKIDATLKVLTKQKQNDERSNTLGEGDTGSSASVDREGS